MKITAELRAQARMIADAPEGAELQEKHISEDEWVDPSIGGVMLNHRNWSYRLKPEPRTIFVNEYGTKSCSAHLSSASATKYAEGATRIAVEYREVVK